MPTGIAPYAPSNTVTLPGGHTALINATSEFNVSAVRNEAGQAPVYLSNLSARDTQELIERASNGVGSFDSVGSRAEGRDGKMRGPCSVAAPQRARRGEGAVRAYDIGIKGSPIAGKLQAADACASAEEGALACIGRWIRMKVDQILILRFHIPDGIQSAEIALTRNKEFGVAPALDGIDATCDDSPALDDVNSWRYGCDVNLEATKSRPSQVGMRIDPAGVNGKIHAQVCYR